MTPPEDRDNSSSNRKGETDPNIFVAFRHIADNHIAAILNSLRDFTTFGTQAREHWNEANEKSKGSFEHCRQKILEHRQQVEEKLAREEEWLRKSWDKMAASADEALQERSREVATGAKAPSKPEHHPKSDAQDLPPKQQAPKPESTVEVLDFNDFLRPFGFAFHQSSRLPLSYVLRSPYSPLHLEDDPISSKAPVDWKAAFEDLLEANRGYSMSERSSKFQENQRHPTNEDWAARLVHRGLVSYDWFSALTNRPHDAWSMAFDHDSGDGDEGEAETELDLYERFLGLDTKLAEKEEVEEAAVRYTQLPSHTREQEIRKPNILSTFTKTETKTLPDGSVVTKTILKKRFADGSEENNETTNTTPPRAVSKDVPEIDEKHARRDNMRKHLHDMRRNDQEKKSNWFWS